MAWKKILLEGDAVSLTSNTPQAVGTTAAVGIGTTGARDDHVHILGTGCINNSNLFSGGVVDANAIGNNAVGSAEIDETATDITFKQVILTPATAGTGTTEGTVYYQSTDKHPYVYQS